MNIRCSKFPDTILRALMSTPPTNEVNLAHSMQKELL